MRTASVRTVGFCVVVALAMLFTGCCSPFGGDLRSKAKRTDELAASAAGLAAMNVTSAVGKIRIDPSEADEVHVTAEVTVKARTQEEADELLDGVRVVAEPSGDTLIVKAVKPLGFGRNQLGVDFTILAPPRLRLDCTTDVGDIHIHGFTQRVKAHTDVGSITCTDLHEAADLHTDVGDIEIAYAAVAPADVEVTAVTDVGGIHFTGPEQMSARIAATVSVGSIHTDRPLTVTGSLKKSIAATVGDGAGRIDLRANVGSIIIQ